MRCRRIQHQIGHPDSCELLVGELVRNTAWEKPMRMPMRWYSSAVRAGHAEQRGLVAGDDLAFAAVHRRCGRNRDWGGGVGAARAFAARSRCAGDAAMPALDAERRRAGRTVRARSRRPRRPEAAGRARGPRIAIRRRCRRSRSRRRAAATTRDRRVRAPPRSRSEFYRRRAQEADGDAAERVDRQVQRHAHAAHGAAQHHALAM